MLDHEHHVAPFADGVPVRRRRLRAHGRGGNADQRRGVEIPDPDGVCDMLAGVLADDELRNKRNKYKSAPGDAPVQSITLKNLGESGVVGNGGEPAWPWE